MRPTHKDWRPRYLAKYAFCEIRGCMAVTGLVFDHCHIHGWIRGVVCASCNVRLGQIDAVIAIRGVAIDLSRTAYGDQVDNCYECSGTDQVAPKLPFLEPWVAQETRARERRALLASPGAPVIKRRKPSLGHFTLGPERTVCGLVAGRYELAEIAVQLCSQCVRAVHHGRVLYAPPVGCADDAG